MKVEIVKAKAFELDPNKKYLVVYETEHELSDVGITETKKAMVKMFEDLDIEVQPAVISNGKLMISEIKEK